MNKIPTLFVRDPEDLSRVTRDVHPDCQWVIDGEGMATRKYDGTCVMFDGDQWWARREVRPGKAYPAGYQFVARDEATGKTVGWEPIEQSAFIKYFLEALNEVPDPLELGKGTYELCGPKINGNPEDYVRHFLICHDDAGILIAPRDFDGLAAWMAKTDYEGIVWHHPDGRMAKLKRKDFPTSEGHTS